MKKTLLALVAVLSANLWAAQLPIVRSTDVVVVGGSTAAVAAAIAAKEAGAEVFLLAPRPYLGEDVAGTLRVVRAAEDDARHPLFRTIFAPEKEGWPFTYVTDLKADKAHPDKTNTMLGDGAFGNASRESVQYADDVTVTLDLGAVRSLEGVALVTYFRPTNKKKRLQTESTGPNVGFRTSAMEISLSADGKAWTPPARVENVDFAGDLRTFRWAKTGCARFVRVKALKAVDAPRQLLGEITVARPAEGAAQLAVRTSPFIVKRALDRALLASRVPYITGVLVCDVVKDANGRFAGVVMANRSGRQVVRAKVLVDATERAVAATLAGGVAAAPFRPGTYPFHRIVVSGETPKGAGVTARAISEAFPVRVNNHLKPKHPLDIEARIWDCTVMIPMKDSSARSFAEAEQIARDRTFTIQQTDAANTLAFLPPDPIRGRVSVPTWQGADALDLGALRVKAVEGVWVLGPRADVARSVVEPMLRPGAALCLGARVGRAVAAEAKTRPAAVGALTCVASAKAPALAGGATLGEHHGELPSYLVNTKGTVKTPDNLPVLATCDTFVVGAGTGGAPAAIAAARHGAKTIVADYLYVEGGVQTDGLIGRYYFGHRVGFTQEIDEGTRATGSVFPQAKSEWYRAEQRKAGAEVWFGVFVNGVVVANGRVTGVVVVMADGTRGLVACRTAIDATGNAELPAMAGEETEFITDEDLSVQGVGLAQMTLGTGYANSDIGFVDDTDAADVFYFALRSRLSLPENTWDQAQVINSRERRRMIGAFYMSAADVVCGRTYPDIITRTYSNFDSHGQTRDDLFFIQDPGHKPMYVNLPYRCLLPKKLDGLLVTGLGISAHRDAMPILRMQPDIQNQGYAAGTASAMAMKAGVAVREIDVKALQRHLVDMKILTPGDLEMKDNFPLPESEIETAVADLADNYKGLPVLMTDRTRALPRIKGAYQTAEGEAKTIYAHVLALLGHPDGEAELLAKFKATPWDKGWNYRGMGQFNRSVSWVDSYAITLGHCKSKAAIPALIAKAAALTERSEYSHFRAIARAFEEIGSKEAIPVLADILKRPGIGGRWQVMGAEPPVVPGYQNTAGDWERTLSLRELCIARALYRLGDTPDGLGRRTLEAYAADPRRTYAKHARLVLGK